MKAPILWGFLATTLLGMLGYFCLLLGAWPLLWLPLLTPVFAYAYMRSRLHVVTDFDRFLAGYGICLMVLVVLGVVFLLTLD